MFLKHSEWEYAREYELAKVTDRIAGRSIRIGESSSTADAQNATAVGYNTFAQYNGVAVGSTAKANSGEAVAVGPDTNVSGWGGVAIGKSA